MPKMSRSRAGPREPSWSALGGPGGQHRGFALEGWPPGGRGGVHIILQHKIVFLGQGHCSVTCLLTEIIVKALRLYLSMLPACKPIHACICIYIYICAFFLDGSRKICQRPGPRPTGTHHGTGQPPPSPQGCCCCSSCFRRLRMSPHLLNPRCCTCYSAAV